MGPNPASVTQSYASFQLGTPAAHNYMVPTPQVPPLTQQTNNGYKNPYFDLVTQPYTSNQIGAPVAHNYMVPTPQVPANTQHTYEGYGAQNSFAPVPLDSARSELATLTSNINKKSRTRVPPPNKKVHEGFKSESSAPKVHAGFQTVTPTSSTKKTFKALVYSKTGPNRNGKTKHFVWLLEGHKRALASTVDVYEPGVVFEGEFKVFDPTKPDEWSCTKVNKILHNYFTGRLDQGHIEVDITIYIYVRAIGDSKFPTTYHREFGIIIDRFGRLPANDGKKKIAIQQQKMDDGDYQWVVTKVYPSENS